MTIYVFRCPACTSLLLREQQYPTPYCGEHPVAEFPTQMQPFGELETVA